MPAVPFPTTSAPGEFPGEGVGLLINTMAQQNEDELSWMRVPGVAPFATITPAVSGPRGSLAAGGQLITAWLNSVVRTTLSGLISTKSPNALPGSGPVTMARNMREPIPQVVIVSDTAGYLYDLATGSLTPLNDTDMSQPNSVSYFSGYFMFTTGAGHIFASELQQVDVKPLSRVRADAHPDGLLRGVNLGEIWLAMGPQTIEAYQDVGASPFPLQRTATIPTGLIAPWAVAGSVAEWDRPLLFVSSDYTVRQLDGLTPVIVSSKDVSLDIYKQRADTTQLRAQVYVQGENAFWSLSCPSWTWEYNLTTKAWHRRESYRRPDWRLRCTVQFGPGWIGLDTQASALCEITSAAYDECGEPLISDLYSAPVKSFPQGMRIPRVWFDFTVGLGRITAPSDQAEPAVFITWSHDGGARWANPLRRSLGQQGEYRKLVQINNLGRASHHGLRLKWSIHDPVHVRFRGAVIGDLKPRGAAPVGVK